MAGNVAQEIRSKLDIQHVEVSKNNRLTVFRSASTFWHSPSDILGWRLDRACFTLYDELTNDTRNMIFTCMQFCASALRRKIRKTQLT